MTRRGLLAAGLVGVAGAVLAGCGGGTDAKRLRADQAESEDTEARYADALLLQQLADVEAGLSEPRHVAALTREIIRLGGPRYVAHGSRPPSREVGEQHAIAACIDALPKLTSSRARSIVAGILADHGGHLIRLDHLAGRPIVPAPFVTGRA